MAITATILLGMLTSLIFLSRWRVDDEGASYYTAKGYRQRVADLVSSKALHMEPPSEDSRTFARPWGQLEFDDDTATPIQKQFEKNSRRLQRDLEQFNETGGGFFEYSPKGNLQLARNFHNTTLPYPRREPWKGVLSLAGEALPSIVSPDLYLGFSETDDDGTLLAADYVVLSSKEYTAPAKQQKVRRARAYELKGEDGAPILRFTLLEKSVGMTILEASGESVYLNGELINQIGARGAAAFLARKASLDSSLQLAPNTAPLLAGDRLRIFHLRSKTQISFRFGQFSGGIVSRKWLENGRQVTVIDPEMGAEFPYLVSLQKAMDKFVQSHPTPASLKQPSVQLTFNRDLNTAVSRIFLEYVRNFDARISAVKHIEAEPACITILNALNGDVLAMPTYPAQEDLERLRRRAAVDPGAALSESRLHRLELNQNLTLMPIGSTTKPLLATAIWDTHPDFSHLVITEPYGQRSEILGYKLFRPYSTKGERVVDYKGFLRMSSNDYTMHLGLLMLANQPQIPAGGRFPAQTKLDVSHFVLGDRIPGGLMRPELTAFAKLRDCFDISLTSDFEGDRGELWDTGPVSDLLRRAGVGENVLSGQQLNEKEKLERNALFRSFSEVLPEATNLRLDQIHGFRGAYASLLLGSGTNYWSNLKLAEAYARLGTGRKIVARIAVDPKKEVALQDFPELPVSSDTLAKVHAGMQQCAEGIENSTAAAIGPSIQAARKKFRKQGLDLFAIAKTGTASRVPPLKKNGQIISEKRECAAFCLYLEVRNSQGEPLAALASATYLQDRAATKSGPKNSGVAVRLTSQFLPELLTWLENQPAVRKAAHR